MDEQSEPQAFPRIDIDQDQEVRYWSKTLRIHPVELRAAVEAIGPVVEDIRAYLGR